MTDAELAMLFELGAAVITALLATGFMCTAVGIWRDDKKWKGERDE